MEDIWDIVYGIFHKERYSLILERSTIVIADDSIDITDKIIRIYDARKK
jgi:Skp family chaperone for outer membrane proteins